nr:MAG TPA: hypothetical protein [Caudoviricetes sp.]
MEGTPMIIIIILPQPRRPLEMPPPEKVSNKPS